MIQKPIYKFKQLNKDERMIVYEVIRGFLRDSQAHAPFGFEGTEEAMIKLMDMGLLRMFATQVGVGLALYDPITERYKPMGVKNNNEPENL